MCRERHIEGRGGEETQRMMANYKPRAEDWATSFPQNPQNKPSQFPDFGRLASRTADNNFLLFKTPGVCTFVMTALANSSRCVYRADVAGVLISPHDSSCPPEAEQFRPRTSQIRAVLVISLLNSDK